MSIGPKRTEISEREHLSQLWKGMKLVIFFFFLKKVKMEKFKLGETYLELIDKRGGPKEAEINV